MSMKVYSYLCLLILSSISGICVAQGSFDSANQSELTAKRAAVGDNSFAATVVYPAGTKFTITAIHPDSAFYSNFYSTFYGKTATAADCSSGITHGIEFETTGSRAGYYSACFYLDGDSFEYFVYGFKFSLISPTPTPTPTSTEPSATFSNGTLILKRMEVDAGAQGKTYYDVTLTLKAQSAPVAFTVDSVVLSK